MSQFQNEAFQFQTLSRSVAMAMDLSFRFTCKLLHILESFILSRSVLIPGDFASSDHKGTR